MLSRKNLTGVRWTSCWMCNFCHLLLFYISCSLLVIWSSYEPTVLNTCYAGVSTLKIKTLCLVAVCSCQHRYRKCFVSENERNSWYLVFMQLCLVFILFKLLPMCDIDVKSHLGHHVYLFIRVWHFPSRYQPQLDDRCNLPWLCLVQWFLRKLMIFHKHGIFCPLTHVHVVIITRSINSRSGNPWFTHKNFYERFCLYVA